MSEILADAEMARQIATADGPVNIVDATGTLIAVCTPVKFQRPSSCNTEGCGSVDFRQAEVSELEINTRLAPIERIIARASLRGCSCLWLALSWAIRFSAGRRDRRRSTSGSGEDRARS